jgi:hypothetical protein
MWLRSTVRSPFITHLSSGCEVCQVGYPDGLCAGSLSDIVRILTISDVFSALIERRAYRPPPPREAAYDIVGGMSGLSGS